MASEFDAIKNIGIGTLAAIAARAAFVAADQIGAALGGPRSAPQDGLGDLSLREAQDNVKKALEAKFAHRNFFNVTVARYSRAEEEGVAVGPQPADPAHLKPVTVTANPTIGFLCVEANYSDYQLTGEKRRIGSTQLDSLQSREPVELQLITYDLKDGSLKRQLRALSARSVNPDGTVGVPGDYAVVVTIEHAFAKPDDVEPNQVGDKKPRKTYVDRFLMRLAGVDYGGLSRRDSGLQELTIMFQQLDPFMSIG